MKSLLAMLILSILCGGCNASPIKAKPCSDFLNINLEHRADEKRISWASTDENILSRGTAFYSDEQKKLFILSPQGHKKPRIIDQDFLFKSYQRIISCVLDEVHDLYDETLTGIVTDYFPLINVCRAGWHYINSHTSGETPTMFLRPRHALDEQRERFIQFSDEAGLFDEWKMALESASLPIDRLSGEWLEHSGLITGKQFLEDYGKHGKVRKDMCQYSERDYMLIEKYFLKRLFPSSIGKVEFVTHEKLASDSN